MKFIYYFLIISLILPFCSIGTNAAVDEQEVKDKLTLLMGQNNSGTDYWFTIPPVYMDESVGHDNSLKILIASPVETDVTVEVKGKGFLRTQKTIPDNVIEFTIEPNIAQAILHSGAQNGIVPAKVYQQAGIHVTSDAPIIVYVIARYMYTSDGFLAIPSSALGTHYINMVYQEPDLNKTGLFAPFTGVTAAYDNTEVNFTMGGGPEGIDASPMGNGQLVHTGESTSQTLNQGDVWLLSINGPRQDLSGSIFKSDKPIAIVSGINCANFPIGNRWCDYTVEMELPVYSWGKQYYVTPMNGRNYNGIIRVFASEDNTNVYRDNELIGNIAKGGGATIGVGYLETRVWPKVDGNGNEIAPHIATIHADKPIAVMYYNTGGQEDNGNTQNTDPFMMTFSPVEQFGNQIYFASPNSATGINLFPENYVNIIFESTSGEIPDDLLFADLSKPNPTWVKVKDYFGPAFENFVVPFNGKLFANKTLKLATEGVFGLKSTTTLIGAYSYGFGPYDSYGYPTAATFDDISAFDGKAPEVTFTGKKDDDLITGSVDDSHSGSSGLSQFYMIKSMSSNYSFEITAVEKGITMSSDLEPTFIPGETKKLNWSLEKVDNSKEGYAVLYLSDRSGNDELLFFGNTITATSVTPEQTLSEYMTVSESSVQILPQALADGFNELSIFNLEGSKVISTDIQNQNSVSISSL
ncbi:MAG: hypothetical protein CVV25_04640, partial [Ignavibacteriae bacterium HGW-Ignavibacteriae-4]